MAKNCDTKKSFIVVWIQHLLVVLPQHNIRCWNYASFFIFSHFLISSIKIRQPSLSAALNSQQHSLFLFKETHFRFSSRSISFPTNADILLFSGGRKKYNFTLFTHYKIIPHEIFSVMRFNWIQFLNIMNYDETHTRGLKRNSIFFLSSQKLFTCFITNFMIHDNFPRFSYFSLCKLCLLLKSSSEADSTWNSLWISPKKRLVQLKAHE